MLPTFVIGLREGLEAALIVGIIAAFLRKQGRPELIRQLAVGVTAAVLICIGVGVGLEVFSQNLPQRQQEGLETVIGILAVAMVTYMVIWMKGHSRGHRGVLVPTAADALDSSGSGSSRGQLAMIAMAFLAVLREGFETSVFLLAAFNETGSGASALIGAVLGIAVAVGLGYGIYRGGVHINLSKFFRATGIVLALVAAGLVVSAIHTAHEAGWLNVGQERLLDLSWLVQPGTVISSLLTGMLGIQPYPVMAEILGWLLYAVPVVVFVAWPPGRAVPLRGLRAALAGAGVLGVAIGGTLAWTAPSVATPAPTGSGSNRAEVVEDGGHLAVRTPEHFPLQKRTGDARTLRLESGSLTNVGHVTAETYTVTLPGGTQHTRLKVGKAAAINGGRMPLGVVARHGTVGAVVSTTRVATVVVEPQTRRVLSVKWTGTERAALVGSSGQHIAVAEPLQRASTRTPAAARGKALDAATADQATLEHRTDRMAVAWRAGLLGAAALLGLALSWWRPQQRSRVTEPTPTLVKT